MFLIFFLVILLSGLTLLTGIILSISGLASDSPKTRNAGFITTGAGLIALVFSIFFAVSTAVKKVEDNLVEPMSQYIDSLGNRSVQGQNSLLEDNRFYLLSDTCRNQQIKYIIEESARKEPAIRSSFYTYFGAQNFTRMPLIYPFAIHCLDTRDMGILVNESNVMDVASAPGNEENVILNVLALNYDENIVVMRVLSYDPQTNQNTDAYTMYNVNDKKITECKTEAELFKVAAKAGYKGNKLLIGLADYDRMF